MSLFPSKSKFFAAIQKDDIATLKKYAADKKPEKWFQSRDYYGTPLLYALKKSQKETIFFLLEHGAEVTRPDNEGAYPLGYAIDNGVHIDVIKNLLDRGADPDKGGRYITPLSYAASRGRLELMNLLIDYKATISGDNLYYAVSSQRTEVIDILLSKGKIDPLKPIPGRNGYLLHYAVSTNDIDMVNHILSHNPNIDVVDNEGATALHYAMAHSKHAHIAQHLIKMGAAVDIQNNKGQTALQYGESKGNHETVIRIKDVLSQMKNERHEQELIVASQSSDTWTLLSDDKIAHIGVYPALQKKITEIFNFESHERMTLVENTLAPVTSNVMTSPVIDRFDMLDGDMLRKVFALYQQQGGSIAEDRALASKPAKPIMRR